MLCSRFLKLEPARPGAAPRAQVEVGLLLPAHRRRLWRSAPAGTAHKFLVVLLTAAVIYSTVPIGKVMGISLIPRDDQSEYEVSVTTPEGYSLERSRELIDRVGSPALEAEGNRARLHDHRPDRGGPRGQGRGGRHARHDLRPDHRPRETRGRHHAEELVGPPRPGAPSALRPYVRPVRGPARGTQVP